MNASVLVEFPHPAWKQCERTLRERQALPVLQGHLGASRTSCLCQSEDVENQRGIVGILWPATAAAAPWERREAGSSRSADHKNLSVPSGSSLLSYPIFFFGGGGSFVFPLAGSSPPADW